MVKKEKRKFTLRQAREYAGLKTADVANQIGVHYQTLRNWELGIYKPNIDELRKLCEIYKMDLEELDL